MGFERESFVGNPHKQDFVDDDEELEYLSGDEIDFNPFGLPPGDPDLLIDDNYDIVTDDDDDYDPEDDYEDFLSDSDYEFGGDEGSEESGSDQDQELPLEVPAGENQESSSNKTSADNKSPETKVGSEVKTNGVDDVSSNEAGDAT